MYDYIENNQFSVGDSQQATPSDSSIDYDSIYDACYYGTYNAIQDYYFINGLSSDFSINNASSTDAVTFSTSTDARLYTAEVASAPTSSAQATEAYLLDTRNILLIFALTWLCVTIYSKLKNLMINYTTKD